MGKLNEQSMQVIDRIVDRHRGRPGPVKLMLHDVQKELGYIPFEAMEKIAAELREFSDRMGENIYENVKDGMEKEEQLKSKVASMKEVRKELRAEYSAGKEEWYKSQQQKLDELKGRYDGLVNGLGSVGERLVKAFPNMESRIHKDALREVKKRVAIRRNKRK